MIIRLGLSDGGPAERSDGSGQSWDVGSRNLEMLGKLTRTTDRMWVDAGFAFVLLPASDRAAGMSLLKRIVEHAPTAFSAEVGVAAFPDDGFTSDALLSAVMQSAGREVFSSGAPHTDRHEAPSADLSSVTPSGNGTPGDPSRHEPAPVSAP